MLAFTDKITRRSWLRHAQQEMPARASCSMPTWMNSAAWFAASGRRLHLHADARYGLMRTPDQRWVILGSKGPVLAVTDIWTHTSRRMTRRAMRRGRSFFSYRATQRR